MTHTTTATCEPWFTTPATMPAFDEIVGQMTKARSHLDNAEERYFSGVAHLDELRAAYEGLQSAERNVMRWQTERHGAWSESAESL